MPGVRLRNRSGARFQQAPTHSSVPSENVWCFQMGTSCLRSSISFRQAAKASPDAGRTRRRRRRDPPRPGHRPDAQRRAPAPETQRRPSRRHAASRPRHWDDRNSRAHRHQRPRHDSARSPRTGRSPGGVVPDRPENLIQGERLIPNSDKLDGLQSGLLTRMIIKGCHTPIVPSRPTRHVSTRPAFSARPAFEDKAPPAPPSLPPTRPHRVFSPGPVLSARPALEDKARSGP